MMIILFLLLILHNIVINIDGYAFHISNYIKQSSHKCSSKYSNIDNDSNNLIRSEVKGIPITLPSSLCNDLADGNYNVYVNSLSVYNINIHQNDISVTQNDNQSSLLMKDINDSLFNLLISILHHTSIKINRQIAIDTSLLKNIDKSITIFNANDEYVDWLSDDELVLASLPRLLVHKLNLLHKGIGVLITNSKNKIFVHQRSATKRLFPSMYDMFIGGVCSSGIITITIIIVLS